MMSCWLRADRRFANSRPQLAGLCKMRFGAGSLTLWLRPDSLRWVPSLDPATPWPEMSEPLYGAAAIDLERVGAYTEGSLLSEDPVQPGVVVRIRRKPPGDEVELRFGSEQNQRGRHVLDGPFIEARVVEIGARGFSGFWEASLGIARYEAGGVFCARFAH
jgi:hypothetical protein